MADQRSQTVHSGATILLMANNKYVGRAQGIDGRRSYGTEGVYEIGSIMPAEHVQNRYEGSITVERYFVKKDNLVKLNLAKLGEDILQLPVLDLVVVSKEDNSIILAYRGCTPSDHSENIRTNVIAGENVTFQYLKASDSRN